MDTRELIQELLVDILIRFKHEPEFLLKVRTKSWDLLNFSNSSLSYKLDVNSNETLSLKYLIDSYNRILNTQKQRANVKSSVKDLFDSILAEAKFQIINNTIVLLSGGYSDQNLYSFFLILFHKSSYILVFGVYLRDRI